MIDDIILEVGDKDKLKMEYSGNIKSEYPMISNFKVLNILDYSALGRQFSVEFFFNGEGIGGGAVFSCALRHSYIILSIHLKNLSSTIGLHSLLVEFAKHAFFIENLHRLEVRALHKLDLGHPFVYEGKLEQNNDSYAEFYSLLKEEFGTALN